MTVSAPNWNKHAGQASQLLRARAEQCGPFVPTAAYRRIEASSAQVVIVTGAASTGKTAHLTALHEHHQAHGHRVKWIHLGDDMPSETEIICVDVPAGTPLQVVEALIRDVIARDDILRCLIAVSVLPPHDWLPPQLAASLEIIHQTEMLLGLDEAAQLLESISGSPAPSQIARDIVQRTAGWAPAVRWYALKARQLGAWSSLDSSALAEEMADQMANTLLGGADRSMREFLAKLAELESFSKAMLFEVLGPDAASLWQRAQTDNILILPDGKNIGRSRLPWFLSRYLTVDWTNKHRTLDSPLLKAASLYCEKKRDFSQAIELAMRASDYLRAEGILLKHIRTMIYERGDFPKVLKWIAILENEFAALGPDLRVWRVDALMVAGQMEAAGQELSRLAQFFDRLESPALRAQTSRSELFVRAGNGLSAELLSHIDDWLGRWERNFPIHAGGVRVLRSLTNMALGHRHAMRQDIMIARQRALESKQSYAIAWVAEAEAYIDLQCGRVERARETILAACEIASQEIGAAKPLSARLELLAARILLEEGKCDSARAHLSAGRAHLSDGFLSEMAMCGIEAASFLTLETDGIEAAINIIRTYHASDVIAAVRRDLLKVDLLIAADRAHEACEDFAAAFEQIDNEWLHRVSGSTVPNILQTAVDIASASVALIMRNLDEVDGIAARLLPIAEAAGHTRAHLALLLLATGSAFFGGRDGEAVRHLARGIRKAADGGYVHTLVEGTRSFKQLLAADEIEAVLDQPSLALLTRVRVSHRIDEKSESRRAPIDHLTGRETDVLRLLDTPLSTQEIAHHIGLSLSTTKWHMHNIYNKLGVKNRSGAVVTARRASII